MSRSKKDKEMKRCPQSGEVQMLAWFPETDYPGSVVCLGCSYGVMIRKGSARKAVSQLGHEGMAGTVRVHYVSRDKQRMSYRKGSA